ncbi:start control protein cdc10 [Colletotrichum spaethianum]|uniref:Start control protein cdc10 n=1 Tax=Colletotrichum spaethianum TaxID=700344 RepID=A0AA37PHU2_9PEZI|nr:start control protein cdc10 [Colletotrichum spaethianum]GKT52434.1 start control protein cdc10 [Colletotrichum spaethianum]
MPRRSYSPPRQLPEAEPEEVYGPEVQLEEQGFAWYNPDKWYPVEIGQIFESRYQVLLKLGFGSASTVWLCRDLNSTKWAIAKLQMKKRCLITYGGLLLITQGEIFYVRSRPVFKYQVL